MPTKVNRYSIKELANDESKNEVLVSATEDIEIGLKIVDGNLIIWLPFGNKFDTISGKIIIKPY